MTENTSPETSQHASQQGPFAAKHFDAMMNRLFQASGAKSDSDLGRVLGITSQSISGARQRKQLPPAWITTISFKFEVSADWLIYGAPPMRRGATEAHGEQPVLPVGSVPTGTLICDPEIMLVPKVKARLSAGGGSLETNGDVAGYYAFRRKFLNRKGNSSQMVLMDVTGDSMEPEIKAGDTVLIDESQTEIIAGGIYAVGMDEEVVVKVVDKTPGKLILRSYNPIYAPYELDLRGDLAEGVRIIGRVIWWCREAR